MTDPPPGNERPSYWEPPREPSGCYKAVVLVVIVIGAIGIAIAVLVALVFFVLLRMGTDPAFHG